MKKALVVTCTFTAPAAVYLCVSVLVLSPPHAGPLHVVPMAALFVMQSSITLLALTRRVARAMRVAVLAGGVAIAWLGVSAIRDILASFHFEGYALVLGAALALQGSLTLLVFAPRAVRGQPVERA